jgi:hypothetical protein
MQSKLHPSFRDKRGVGFREPDQGNPEGRFCATSPNPGHFDPKCHGYRDEVSEMNHCDFHYSHLLPKKPGILPLEETMTKQCRRCGAEFVTRSRIRKRCDACQNIVSAEKQKKANERLKARRAARRLCLLKAS